jgi:hypothetical protein
MVRVVAMSTSCGGAEGAHECLTLEMTVSLNPDGCLGAAVQDEMPQRCRLLRDGREEWSGTLITGADGWVMHSDLGDDEPIWVLHVRTLRPGEHFTLCNPGGEQISFRVGRVSRSSEERRHPGPPGQSRRHRREATNGRRP